MRGLLNEHVHDAMCSEHYGAVDLNIIVDESIYKNWISVLWKSKPFFEKIEQIQ